MAKPKGKVAGVRLDVPVILGVSAAVYAASLAAVTGLQAGQDQAVRDANVELAGSIADARLTREDAEVQLLLARHAYGRLAGGYEDVRAEADRLSREVAELASAVEAVTGSAAQLPASVPLRPAQRIVTVTVPVAAPAVHATTGASG